MYGSNTEILKCKSDEQKVAYYDKQEQQGRAVEEGLLLRDEQKAGLMGLAGFPFLSVQTFIWTWTALRSSEPVRGEKTL